MMPLCDISAGHLSTSDDMILKLLVQFNEISAPSPDSDNESSVIFRMYLCIKQNISVDGIELKLMASTLPEQINEFCSLVHPICFPEKRIVEFNCQRSAIADPAEFRNGKITYD